MRFYPPRTLSYIIYRYQFSLCEGSTIELLDNIDDEYTIEKACTIVTNGKTITVKAGTDFNMAFADGKYTFTAKVYVAQVGGTKYESFAEAYAKGTEITLLANVGDVTISKACVINAGEYTINITPGDGYALHTEGSKYTVYETVKIYVYNANKTTKTYIHVWTEGKNYTNWPGENITSSTHQIGNYKYNVYTLPYDAIGKKLSFVVNNGGDSCKSADFTTTDVITSDKYLLFHKYAIADITSTKAIPNIIYLKPGSNWSQAGAKFGIHLWATNGSSYDALITDHNGEGIYNIILPDTKYTKLHFVRLNSNATSFDWNKKWNETGDLTTKHTTHYFDTKDWWDTQTDTMWVAF